MGSPLDKGSLVGRCLQAVVGEEDADDWWEAAV
jgi:hypothetical protein